MRCSNLKLGQSLAGRQVCRSQSCEYGVGGVGAGGAGVDRKQENSHPGDTLGARSVVKTPHFCCKGQGFDSWSLRSHMLHGKQIVKVFFKKRAGSLGGQITHTYFLSSRNRAFKGANEFPFFKTAFSRSSDRGLRALLFNGNIGTGI